MTSALTSQHRSLLPQRLDAPSTNTVTVNNPSDGEALAYLPTMNRDVLEVCVEQAFQAQKEWSALTAKQRSEALKRWHQRLLENTDALASLMTLEQGKPLAEAKGEVAYGASFIEWFAEEAKRSYGDTIPAPQANKRLVTIVQPVGVACAITPWNFPIAMITRKAAPALAAGCSFIVKPSELTPLSAFAIAELAYQSGIPKEVFQVVLGDTPQMVGKLFCHSSNIRKLSFTGSTPVGKRLLEQAAQDVKRVSLELGGNAPFIVFEDADIDQAVQGAIASKFRNAGQTCVCANRFFVHQDVYEEFISKFDAEVQRLVVGDGMRPNVDIGPLINAEAKTKVKKLSQQALAQGAQWVTPPKDLDGNFVAPAILREVTTSMDIAQAEIFGPIAPVIRFETEQELIEMANDTCYGLASYFYSQNIHRIWRVAEQLEYGMVGINEGLISTEVAPFGGVKHSGLGREGGHQGLAEYLETKYLCFGG